MTCSKITIWEPNEESDLTEEIKWELDNLYKYFCTESDLHLFSWDNEDNEDCPHIAKYMSDKYNEFKFIIYFTGHLD